MTQLPENGNHRTQNDNMHGFHSFLLQGFTTVTTVFFFNLLLRRKGEHYD